MVFFWYFPNRMIELLEQIISPSIFFQLSTGCLIIAVALFQLENVRVSYFSGLSPIFLDFLRFFFQNITDFSLDVATSIAELFIYPGENYVLCYFITTLLINAASIDDIAYCSMWYNMQRSDQIIVAMIVHRSQKVVEMKGLGILNCSLQAYLTVRFSLSANRKRHYFY